MAPRTPIAWLRSIGFYEGGSFLLLLFVAMPLKYLAGQALAVSIVGLAHGILFLLYCGAVARARFRAELTWGDGTRCLVAALLPFGPFLMDKRLQRLDGRTAGN